MGKIGLELFGALAIFNVVRDTMNREVTHRQQG
jgi:hypothetical protein